MRNLDVNKIYDLSELTSEERELLFDNYFKNKRGFKNYRKYFIKIDSDVLFYHGKEWEWHNDTWKVINEDFILTNAKELFYTLENVQVDCRELTDEHIKEMANVFEANGFNVDKKELKVDDIHCYLCFVQYDVWVCDGFKSKQTITYEKFIELFGSQSITVEASLNQVPDDSKLVKNHTEKDLETIDSKSKNNFKDITDSISDLLEYKNEKYGNTILEPLNIFSGKSKAGHEIDKKLSRVKNSKELRKNDVVDIIGYLVLTCREFGWNNFDEFKD